MPRNAIEVTPKTLDARAMLTAYLAEPGRSGLELSRRSGVPQYTISRFKTGRTKTLTPAMERALRIAIDGIAERRQDISDRPRIRRALGLAWDGSEDGAELLARVIESLAPLIRSARSIAGSGRPP